MAILSVPNPTTPASQQTFVMLIQVSEGAGSITFRFPESSGLPACSFGPEEFTAPEIAANQAQLALLVAKAKARAEAMAAENGDTISWT